MPERTNRLGPLQDLHSVVKECQRALQERDDRRLVPHSPEALNDLNLRIVALSQRLMNAHGVIQRTALNDLVIEEAAINFAILQAKVDQLLLLMHPIDG